jgi:3-hydroxy-9,10-secoandrosta-1,3,5(10)-triene-9,17-dione monooxygenase
MEGRKPATEFSRVTYDEALERAHSLVPLLREEAAQCERIGRLTPKVLEAVHRTGLFRYLQPKVWGGMELPFVAHYDIPEILAHGDISTAWVVVNLAGHHRSMTWWPEKAQEEVWGDNPDAGIASGIAYQQGRAVPVDGGLSLSGEWNFSSGTDHSEWSQLACIVREGDKPVDYVFCLLHRSQYEVLDDWQVLGMRATSSKTVRCKDVFVPAHRVVSMYLQKPGGHSFPGLEIHRNPAYRVPISALGGNGIAGCIVGNARAALETSIEWIKSRSTNYTGAKMRDFQTVQLRIGLAGAKIDAGALLIRNDCVEAERIVAEGGNLDMETRLRYKRNTAVGVKLVCESVDLLHEMAGANGIYDRYPLQRMFRDSHAAAGHFSFSVDAQLPPWGLVALGGDVKSPTL